MLGIFRHFILSTLFALFASHASAMFIQADWYEASDPQVGTNRYAYSHNDPINLADPLGNVPYNPGGDTSTGWKQDKSGVETYDSRTDRGSIDYLSDSGVHTIGRYDNGVFSKDELTGSRTRTRSRVNSHRYDSDTGYRRAEDDAVVFSGSQNMEHGRNAAGIAIGAASLVTGAGEAVMAGRGLFSAGSFVSGFRAVATEEAKDIVQNGYRAGPNSSAGKWFTESRKQAEQFLSDQRFKADKIVQSKVPQSVYDRSYKVQNLDNRGPSFYVSPEDLPFIK